MTTETSIDLLFEYMTGAGVRAESERNELALYGLKNQPLFQEACRLMRALPYALEQQIPPIELKARILTAMAREQIKAPEKRAPEVLPYPPPHATHAHQPPPPLIIRRAEEGQWAETGFEGVAYKKLFSDHETGYSTMLLRMAPGARFPSHRHAGYEECYVLQGDAGSGEVELFAGDYQRMIGGTTHQTLHTKHGCLLLLVASENNELILS